jgi:hypothetical protein
MTRADARLSMRVEGVQEVEGAVEEGTLAQVVTESQNISASGVYCMSTHFLAPYSKVALTLVLPRIPGTRGGNQLIKCEGIVVRCTQTAGVKRGEKAFELACMFSDLDERRRGLIEAFVTWRNLEALRAATGMGARSRKMMNGKPAARAARPAKSRSRTRAASGRSANGRRDTVH